MNAFIKLLTTPIGGKRPETRTQSLATPPRQRRHKRNFDRFRIPVPITAKSGRRQVIGTTATLGMGGLFLHCDSPFATKTPVNLTLAAKNRQITAQGKVVYNGQGGMGIRFTALTPLALSALKTLFSRDARVPKT